MATFSWVHTGDGEWTVHIMLELHLAGEMVYAVDTEVPDTERAAA
jgi:hypothetical protein